MKKYTMLGVTKNECCILECLLPFDCLVPDEIVASDFNHSSCGWCGRSEVDYTLDRIKMRRTGGIIILDKPITFYGEDYDWGHYYDWSFTVNEIHELCNEK